MTHSTTLKVTCLVALLITSGCGDSRNARSTSESTRVTAGSDGAGSSSTSGADTTTSSPSTSAPPVVGGNISIWPPTGSALAYPDPVEVARAFAIEYVGFVDPVIGMFQQGDSRSGEVEVRPTDSGPATTVLVRQVGPGDNWSVIGCATASISLSDPTTMSTVESPVSLSGTSTAFEGTVQVLMRDSSGAGALGEGYVTGGSMGEMGPFQSQLEFSAPTTDSGSLMLYTQSMENGAVWEASVIGIRFP